MIKIPSSSAHWRDTARAPRFFIVDARAAFPVLLFMAHIRVWTGIVVLIAILFFAAIERYGFTVPVFLRWFRTFIAGRRKLARPWWV